MSTTEKCDCGLDVIRLQVKKNGPNFGRFFIKCPKNENPCKLFKWYKEGGGNEGSSSEKRKASSISTIASNVTDLNPKCSCDIPAKRGITQKGENVGKVYYCCEHNECGYFNWETTLTEAGDKLKAHPELRSKTKASIFNEAALTKHLRQEFLESMLSDDGSGKRSIIMQSSTNLDRMFLSIIELMKNKNDEKNEHIPYYYTLATVYEETFQYWHMEIHHQNLSTTHDRLLYFVPLEDESLEGYFCCTLQGLKDDGPLITGRSHHIVFEQKTGYYFVSRIDLYTYLAMISNNTMLKFPSKSSSLREAIDGKEYQIPQTNIRQCLLNIEQLKKDETATHLIVDYWQK